MKNKNEIKKGELLIIFIAFLIVMGILSTLLQYFN